MANPFIADAKTAFQDVKGDLRAAYEAGDLTKQQFQEAKGQAKDIFSGYKGDVRSGAVTEYSNPFATFSYTPTGGISTLDTGTTGATTGAGTTGVTTTGVTTPVVETPVWMPSETDLYEYLNPKQETRLTRLANLYASGELEGREGKIRRLENLLEQGQLGTLESFFGTPTYTTPTDLGFDLPTGVTAEQAASYISQYGVSDPTRVYQYATSLGISPEQAATLLSGYGTTRTFGGPTIFGSEQLEDIFSRGQGGYQTAFTNLFESTFRSQAEQAALDSRLG